jgi:soluble lytic murein transglycosylase-like protein
MVDISSISAEGYERVGGRASQGGGPDGRDASTFRSILLEAQMQRLSVWSQLGQSSPEPVNLFNEYRIILEQARQTNAPNDNPSAVSQRPVNPQLIARHYEAESNRVFLDAGNSGTRNQLLSLSDLAALTGGIRGIPGSQFQQLIRNESGFDPNAIGPKGGLGLGQLLPDTAKALGLRTGEDREEESVWHPASNLDATARQLRSFHDQFIERGVSNMEAWSFATGAFHAGIGNILQALDLLKDEARPEWDQVAKELPRITGSSAKETIEYVNSLK